MDLSLCNLHIFFIFIFFRPTDQNYFEKNPCPNKSIWFGLISIVDMIRFKLFKAYVAEILSNTNTICGLDEFFSRGIKTNFSYWYGKKSLYFFLNASTDLPALILDSFLKIAI